ncbi:MAG: hypothetical protein M4579_001879, partial [Chaenotheca gracillima]
RLKEMKQMQRDPLAATKARKAERKADEKSGLITIKPVKLDATPSSSGPNAGSGGGFKKGAFKNAFGQVKAEEVEDEGVPKSVGGFKKISGDEDIPEKAPTSEPLPEKFQESDTEDEGYEMYDPRHPTD